jgi:hypothetical protein
MLHIDTNRNGGSTGGVVGIAFSPGWQGHQNWGIVATNKTGGGYTQGDLSFVSQLNDGSIHERMRLSGAGNVGIGTSTPTFTAVSGSTNQIGLEIQNGNNDSSAHLKLTGRNNTGTPGQATSFEIVHRGDALKTSFIHGGTEVWEFDSSGHAHLGMNDSDTRLTFGSTGTANTNSSNNIRAVSSTLFYNSPVKHLWEINGTEKLQITSDGPSTGGLFSAGTLKVVGQQSVLNRRTQIKHFVVSFPHGVANQKVKLIIGASYWGQLEINLTGTYSNQNMIGYLVKKFALGFNASNLIYHNKSRITEDLGVTSENFHIGEAYYDSSISKYVIVITHRTSNGNALEINVKTVAASAGEHTTAQAITVGSVYTSDSTVYGEQQQTPSFKAYRPSGNNWSLSTGSHVQPFTNAMWNYGGNYNTSTYTFTAPVTGVYHFTHQCNAYGLSTGEYVFVKVQTSNGTYHVGQINGDTPAGGGDQVSNGSVDVILSAGQTASALVQVVGGSVGFSSDNQAIWNSFSGFLVHTY